MNADETPQEGKERLQALVDSHTNGARMRRRRVFYAGLVGIGVALTLMLGLLIDRLNVTFTNDAQIAQVATAIQAERARTIRRSCREQNVRHAKLLKAFDPLLETRNATEAERREARVFAKALADAIAPKRDCGRVVRRSVIRERQDNEP